MQQTRVSKVFGRHLSRPLKVQKKSLYETLLPTLRFEYKCDQLLPSPLYLEIGFGGGEHLAFQALRNSTTSYIGAEPFINGVASLLKHIHDNDIKNIHVWDNDIRILLEQLPKENVLDGVYLLFADPWPKKRHYKRRFIQDDMIEKIHALLKPGSCWYIATDHADYRQWMLEHFERYQHLFEQIRPNIYERPDVAEWPITRYEEKAKKEGRDSSYMIYKKIQLL